MSGKERRAFIIQMLKDSKEPVTGQELAEKTDVSRQVIVTDVALLKTANEPIIATNRGYLYFQEQTSEQLYRKVIACNHTPEQTKDELEIIVDCGVTVTDVTVEHPIYGELTGSLRIASRYDVEQFITSLQKFDAPLLSVLTGGVHLHTLEADSLDKINAACDALKEANYLCSEFK